MRVIFQNKLPFTGTFFTENDRKGKKSELLLQKKIIAPFIFESIYCRSFSRYLRGSTRNKTKIRLLIFGNRPQHSAVSDTSKTLPGKSWLKFKNRDDQSTTLGILVEKLEPSITINWSKFRPKNEA